MFNDASAAARTIAAVFLAAVFCCSAVPVRAESGRVLSVTGPERVYLGEKLRNVKVVFEAVEKKHNVTLRWTDTKFRLCWEGEFEISPPRKTLTVTVPIEDPIGYRHFIEVYVDGALTGVLAGIGLVDVVNNWWKPSPISLGCHGTSADILAQTERLTGLIDEVAFTHGVIQPAEIFAAMDDRPVAGRREVPA